MYQSITEEAWGLVHSVATQCSPEHGLGTMSPAAYDTAWVAMTEKKDKNGKYRPLFPEAYDYLKETQAEDGSWAAETSDADGIINTLAALLALKKQERQFELARADNERRCRAAEESLHRMLEGWDLESTDRVGMEVLVPNLLRLLEAEGINFDFPCRKPLMKLNKAKLARLGPVLTSPVQTTLIHTLEAFVGTLDFDKVKQHKMPNGSMLASPSSTAAYLMNSSTWDDEAEAYLRMVYEKQFSMGHRGGFPSAYPSTIFEITWVLETLLESGFDKEDFLLADVRKLTLLLESNIRSHRGIVGWAPGCLPDADDTAKTISVLRMLGFNEKVEPMLKAFEADASFITYRGERNASTSANCNILLCLLRDPEPAKYTQSIVKCVNFLAKSWMSNNGPDKWHTSVQYPMMLIAQAFMLFLKRWGKKELDLEAVPARLVHQDVPRTLLDILSRTMRLQNADGSWESKREVTAYAILTLAPLLGLPWVDFLKPEGIACMYRGKAYLENNRNQWKNAEKLWIEKTVYSSSNLSQAYCLAASKIVVSTSIMPQKIADLFPSQMNKKISKMSGFFANVLPFSQAPKWKLQLSLVQSAQYAAALRGSRYNIFPTIEKANDEKYQEYIPFTWIGCRDFLSTAIPAETLWEMMLVSMFNFQVDAYMETVVWDQFHNRLPKLKAFIRALCSGTPEKRKRTDDHDAGQSPKKVHASNDTVIGTVNGTADSSRASITNGHANGESIQTNGLVNSNASGVPEEASSGSENGTSDDESKRKHGKRDSVMGDSNPPSPMREKSSNCKRNSGVVLEEANGFKRPLAPAQRLIEDLEKGIASAPGTDDGEIEGVLTKFVNYALQHPKVLQSPPSLRTWLAHELETFLLAHITHMEDCANMSESSDVSSGAVTWARPRTTFFKWVRTTSADHTSAPYSFVFYLCLIGEKGQHVFSNVRERYALEDASRHLATMCRQYNDFGSVVRDQEEKNLNSVNFPEFVIGSANTGTEEAREVVEARKKDLLAVAEYERRCLSRVLGELEESLDPAVMEKLKLLIQVTDLYGHIYVARDIGIRRVEESKRSF
ncbi:Ent-kaurene synthase [Corynespora cassiicola Philippines]|uniref:Ent-kaurene synthase n=1 Tax=Corynespora cassiicola Philippines TaxID=1448308 RepID=A0A2T2P8Z1_CORCC|nr:Ent-kaurene synthase [Corynespora cassiicola Philippines]